MGAVLEMKQTIWGALAALALAGCGQGGSQGGSAADASSGAERATAIVSQVQGLIGGIGSQSSVSAPRAVPGGFTSEAIAAEPGAYRLVQINALGLLEPARIIQENGDEVTLALQSGPTAAYDGGVLVATRGFGDDLITMDSGGVLSALRAGGGSIARRMETLDGQDQIRTSNFSCTITPAGSEAVNLGVREVTLRRMDERCQGEAIIFNNIYWLDQAGDIAASRQYVSPTVAYLRSNRL
jgi:hypothetical protein